MRGLEIGDWGVCLSVVCRLSLVVVVQLVVQASRRYRVLVVVGIIVVVSIIIVIVLVRGDRNHPEVVNVEAVAIGLQFT